MEDNTQVISGKILLRAVGTLGMALPVIMLVGTFFVCEDGDILSSLSHYYHTSLGIAFTGILCIVAFAFYAYKGYDKIDNYLGYAVTLLAVGVALFPTSTSLHEMQINTCLDSTHLNGWKSNVHFTSAALLFGVFAYFCLFQFTKSKLSKDKIKQIARITKQKGGRIASMKTKNFRNTIYKVCGILIVLSVVFIALFGFVIFPKNPDLKEMDITFWGEFVALWAFGFAWLVKGEIIFGDNKV